MLSTSAMPRKTKNLLLPLTATGAILASASSGKVKVARLPQHRVRSSKRQVPYPENHPLSRHLREDDVAELKHQQGLEQFEYDFGGLDEFETVVRGDGWRSSGSRMRERRRQRKSKHINNEGEKEGITVERGRRRSRPATFDSPSTLMDSKFGKLLEWFKYSLNNADKIEGNAKEFEGSSGEEERESVQEGELLEKSGDTLHYWTVTGRNLIFGANDGNGNGTSGSDDTGEINQQTEEYNQYDPSMDPLEENVVQHQQEELLVNETWIDNENSNGVEGVDESDVSFVGIASNGTNLTSDAADDSNITAISSEHSATWENVTDETQKEPSGTTNTEDFIGIESSTSSTSGTAPSYSSGQNDQNINHRPNNRPLYQPLRLRAIFTDDETSGFQHLTPVQRKILMEEMINPALYAWSQALYVVPVGGGTRINVVETGADDEDVVGGDKRSQGDENEVDILEPVLEAVEEALGYSEHEPSVGGKAEEEDKKYLNPNDSNEREGGFNVDNEAEGLGSAAEDSSAGNNGKEQQTVNEKDEHQSDDGSNGRLVVDRNQLYDGISCGPGLDSGLPSVRVPEEHLTNGLEDTDTVIYISVAFADDESSDLDGTLSSTSSDPSSHDLNFLYAGGPGPRYGGFFGSKLRNRTSSVFMSTNETIRESQSPTYSPSSEPSSAPSQLEEIVDPKSRPTCSGTYLASATYCSTDQYDRPVAGILSICIPLDHRSNYSGKHRNSVNAFFHKKEQVQRNIVTLMHEMGHILGFNAQSLAYFRDGDTGVPLTERGEDGDVKDVEVECTGVSLENGVSVGSGTSMEPASRQTSVVPLPSTDIMQFRSVRGGVRVATVVTPTVQRVVRNMFGCQTLMGAELQSGEGQFFQGDAPDDASIEPFPLSPGECIGDHWERRLFRTDLLNPIVDDVPYSLLIPSLTLAYFADTGWYKVNTARIAPVSIWGRNAGCNFVEKKCITSNGQVSAGNNPFFCNNFMSSSLPSSPPLSEEEDAISEITEIHGCDLDSSRKAVCSLVEYDSPLPDEYNYFTKPSQTYRTSQGPLGAQDSHEYFFGGSDPTLDYCPVFEGFSNGECEDPEAKIAVEVHSGLEVFGAKNSRCVIGHVHRKRTALCVPIACVIQDQSLRVKVDGYWKPCQYAGQIISMWWNPNDYVVCPDPARICPTFYCRNDCFREGGICDYESGQCMCSTPRETTNTTAKTSWISTYYSPPLMEPCSDHTQSSLADGSYQIVERIEMELPDYYVDNATLLSDDPKAFDAKVSRMFAQLSTGEVVGLVASFMMFIIFSCLLWSQIVRCHKERLLGASISKVKSSVGLLSDMLRDAPWSSLSDSHHGTDTPPPRQRPSRQNPQKDKMVATLLVQMRTEGAAIAQQEQQERLQQLGGLMSVPTSVSEDDMDTEKAEADSTPTQTVVDLSSTSERIVFRSELPPLPGGRVLSVVGARLIDDIPREEQDAVEDARSTMTAETSESHVSSRSLEPSQASQSAQSDYVSPLYEDDEEVRISRMRGMLRLRHGNRLGGHNS